MKLKSTPKRSKAVEGKSKKTSAKSGTPVIKKQYLKSNKTCKVTFKLQKEAAPEAQVVTVVGDFNNWNETEAQMKKLKSGDFTLTLELSSEKEYRYRYLIDSSRWENDWQADKYVPNDFDCDDSVLSL